MALDEALLESAGRGDAPPTLRLYAWEPACLSLGYAQPLGDVNFSALSANGWGLVRRPTGGRAILHTDELTYSVCGPPDEPRLAGSVLESYQVLSRALLLALQRMGGTAQASQTPGSIEKLQNPVCFEIPSNYEITVNGKKLIGSAQARRKYGVLQHGTLPLYGDLSRIIKVLTFQDRKAQSLASNRLLERATTLENVLESRTSWETASQAFREAFKDTLNLELIESPPTREELERANELLIKKYTRSEWTERV